jgi:hypothetical protein
MGKGIGMSHELVKVMAAIVPATVASASLPEPVERAGGAARFAWEEFFHAEHHNRHTQKAYLRAVKAFLAWAEGQGVELAAITPGMVGQYLVGLGGSPAKRVKFAGIWHGFRAIWHPERFLPSTTSLLHAAVRQNLGGQPIGTSRMANAGGEDERCSSFLQTAPMDYRIASACVARCISPHLHRPRRR